MIIRWVKRKIEKRRRERRQRKEKALQLGLVQLRELFLAIDEFLQRDGNPRWMRKRFWDEFRKSRTFRNDVFDALLEDENVDKAIGRLIKNVTGA